MPVRTLARHDGLLGTLQMIDTKEDSFRCCKDMIGLIEASHFRVFMAKAF